MKETQSILNLAEETEPGGQLALATVVHLQGSAYRRPGARMLVADSGCSAGSISGGCLENDVRERAQRVMITGQPVLVTYDSMSPTDIVIGMGLGCNGIVQVLIEPVRAEDGEGILAFLGRCRESRQRGQCATVFGAKGFKENQPAVERLFCWPDGHLSGAISNPALREELVKALQGLAGSRTVSEPMEFSEGSSYGVLLEAIAPPLPLIIFGGGEDARPLAQFAGLLGWHVTVIDARPAYALPERFPSADAVHCMRHDALNGFILPSESVVMIMTHHYEQDKELLRTLLPRGFRYTGILGPKTRTRRLLGELAAGGVFFSEETLATLHGPAGLDIGADTPQEIALSILAEIQATLARRSGEALRDRAAGIHEEPLPQLLAV
jgi:xanthine/CO dehydrogenase XdhC/CoxF family maturation factor